MWFAVHTPADTTHICRYVYAGCGRSLRHMASLKTENKLNMHANLCSDLAISLVVGTPDAECSIFNTAEPNKSNCTASVDRNHMQQTARNFLFGWPGATPTAVSTHHVQLENSIDV